MPRLTRSYSVTVICLPRVRATDLYLPSQTMLIFHMTAKSTLASKSLWCCPQTHDQSNRIQPASLREADGIPWPRYQGSAGRVRGNYQYPCALLPLMCLLSTYCSRYEVPPALSESTSNPYARRMRLREHKQVACFTTPMHAAPCRSPCSHGRRDQLCCATSKGPSYVAPQHNQ
ncbi:hypothetical protein EDB86DRAFT_1373781 [Lactarius hatsudake]|nr:hypothetical protein EDB86DRAFT_1373781 [Lactarius hatsudake]